jgi:hypothetical protein
VCISHFLRLHFFWPFSMSYHVCVSFSMFFSVSLHIPGHTVILSHFPRFSVFSP